MGVVLGEHLSSGCQLGAGASVQWQRWAIPCGIALVGTWETLLVCMVLG